jgi:hypothetical protein
MLTISFLRLAADSAQSDDSAETEVANSVAEYAAESGLVAAELRLKGLGTPPPAGLWLSGLLETSRSSYRVEVVSGSATEFRLLVKGSADAEAGKVVTSVIEAEVARAGGDQWTVRSRKRGT